MNNHQICYYDYAKETMPFLWEQFIQRIQQASPKADSWFLKEDNYPNLTPRVDDVWIIPVKGLNPDDHNDEDVIVFEEYFFDNLKQDDKGKWLRKYELISKGATI